jgi:hypothetical protein
MFDNKNNIDGFIKDPTSALRYTPRYVKFSIGETAQPV